MEQIEKQCSKCSETKPIEEFPADKRRPSGRVGTCRACKNSLWIPRKDRQHEPITQKRIIELLSYDVETGNLHWRVSFKSGISKGDIAGYLDGYGYVSVSVDGHPHKAHRLIWLMVHGFTPKFIDHIDHDRANNRLSNLRDVTRTENQRNMSMHADNTSGVTGVHARKDRPGWFSTYIGHGKNRKYLGNFRSFDEAVEARISAEIQMGFHENHGK